MDTYYLKAPGSPAGRAPHLHSLPGRRSTWSRRGNAGRGERERVAQRPLLEGSQCSQALRARHASLGLLQLCSAGHPREECFAQPAWKSRSRFQESTSATGHRNQTSGQTTDYPSRSRLPWVRGPWAGAPRHLTRAATGGIQQDVLDLTVTLVRGRDRQEVLLGQLTAGDPRPASRVCHRTPVAWHPGQRQRSS